MYLSAVRLCTELLNKKGNYQKIIEICRNALLIQPYTEDYYYHMIRAYASLENYSAASDLYARVKMCIRDRIDEIVMMGGGLSGGNTNTCLLYISRCV